MKIVAILNHKGGVGKTTFVGSTAQALALSGYRVLVIDNDSQHNLTTMMGLPVCGPNIRDVYRATPADAPAGFLKSIRTTEIDQLHCITGHRDLSDADIPGALYLKKVIEACGLERFYDYVLIDNSPGLDKIQASSVYAAMEIFVPTELMQFAIDGVAEMEQILEERYPNGARITKVIPNFFRDVKRCHSYIAALNKLFPGRVTATAIPVDNVFDEMVTEGKILFLHRLYSKGAAYYLKIIHELFDLSEDAVWQNVVSKRNERLTGDARQRLVDYQLKVRKDPV